MSPEVVGPEKGIGDYLAAIWRRKFTVLLTAVVAVAVAVGLDLTRTKQYTSSAQVLLTVPGATVGNSNTKAATNQPDIATDIQLITSSQVRQQVQKSLGKVSQPSVSQVGQTNVVSISATSPYPKRAAKVANAYALAYLSVSKANYLNGIQAQENALQAQINALQNQINQLNAELPSVTGSNASNVESQLTSYLGQQQTLKSQLSVLQQGATAASGGQIVNSATPSSSPSSPKYLQDALFALGIGLLIGIGLALFRDYLDDRIRERDDLTEAAPGLPILGMIPEVPDWKDRRNPFLVELARPRSPSAEAYRSLRTSIQFMGVENPIKMLQVTSPAAADGKTTTSANLAVAMAEAGTRVVLVSCDLRKPRIHEFFGLHNDVGLTSVLVGDASLVDAIQNVPEVDTLSLIASGPVPPNPSELLAGAHSRRIFAELSHQFDIVLIDSSPLLPVTDGSVLAGMSDAVLLITAANLSTRRDITRGLELLDRVSANVVGCVLNRAVAGDAYVYYRYGYGSTYGAAPETAAAVNGQSSSGTTEGAGRTNGAGRHARASRRSR